MPQLLKPEQVTWAVVDETPNLTISEAVERTDGWRFLNRATLCVLDGLGDAGFIIPRTTASVADLAPAGWDAAIDATGRVHVVTPAGELDATVIE